MKSITALTPEEKITLDEAYRNHPCHRVRQRAQCLLLSNRGYLAARLCEWFDVRHETVSAWFEAWETQGLVGLFDKPRSGRPPVFLPAEQEQFIRYVDANPHQAKEAAARLQAETGKKASYHAFKRILKQWDYRWKRCRQSVSDKRDDDAFERDTQAMGLLKQQEDDGIINLRYFDQSGFSTTSSVPYGWQAVGKTRRIPCHRSKRLNVLGFMGRNNELFFHATEKSVTAETVIEVMDDFAEHYDRTEFQQTGKICYVVMDNASIHRAQAFKDKMGDWLLCGVQPRFIPPYCPELNLIEILWRKTKYEWLPLDAYQCFAHLKAKVVETLQRFGSELRITFA